MTQEPRTRQSAPRDYPAEYAARKLRLESLCPLLSELAQRCSVQCPCERCSDSQPRGRGRPPHCLYDIAICAVLKVRAQLDGMSSASIFKDAMEHGYVSTIPSGMALSRFLNAPETAKTLERMLALSATPFRKLVTDIAIDSTGLSTTTRGGWVQRRFPKTTHRNWVKAHTVMDCKTKAILSLIVTPENASDIRQFIPLLRDIVKNGFHPAHIMADRAYLSDANAAEAERQCITPIIRLKKNSVLHGPDYFAWNKMFRHAREDPEDFMRLYGQRNGIESGFSALKRVLGGALKSKNFLSRKNETLCKALAYNYAVIVKEMCKRKIKSLDSLDPRSATE